MKRAFYFVFICFLPLLALPQHTIFDPATYTLAASLPSNMEIVDYQGDSYLRIITSNNGLGFYVDQYLIPSNIDTLTVTYMHKIGEGNGPLASTTNNFTFMNINQQFVAIKTNAANESLLTYKIRVDIKVSELNYIKVTSIKNGFTLITGDTIYIKNIKTFSSDNTPPIANAGPDQIVDEGDLVTLNGTSSSDTDSDPLTYLWTAPAGITLSSNTASQPTFTAPEVSTATPYEFTLVVNDGTTDSERDTVVVTVNNVEGVPATLSVDNVVVGYGEERCYGAGQTITVAENGPVVANNNSTVTFIAGESIVFYPGFHAQPGSNVHAYITTNQTFCEAIKSQTIVSANTNFDININEETLQTEGSILVFPNPNNGRFTLQLQNYNNHAQVMIVNLAGKVIYQSTVNSAVDVEIDMLNAPRGIYSIVVSDNETVKTSKMVVY